MACSLGAVAVAVAVAVVAACTHAGTDIKESAPQRPLMPVPALAGVGAIALTPGHATQRNVHKGEHGHGGAKRGRPALLRRGP